MVRLVALAPEEGGKEKRDKVVFFRLREQDGSISLECGSKREMKKGTPWKILDIHPDKKMYFYGVFKKGGILHRGLDKDLIVCHIGVDL